MNRTNGASPYIEDIIPLPFPAMTLRFTRTLETVVEVLIHADVGEKWYGLRLCEETQLGPGTVYPILERLFRAGWLTFSWETVEPTDRPRRKYFELTKDGRAAFAAARAARRKRNGWVPADELLARGGPA